MRTPTRASARTPASASAHAAPAGATVTSTPAVPTPATASPPAAVVAPSPHDAHQPDAARSPPPSPANRCVGCLGNHSASSRARPIQADAGTQTAFKAPPPSPGEAAAAVVTDDPEVTPLPIVGRWGVPLGRRIDALLEAGTIIAAVDLFIAIYRAQFPAPPPPEGYPLPADAPARSPIIYNLALLRMQRAVGHYAGPPRPPGVSIDRLPFDPIVLATPVPAPTGTEAIPSVPAPAPVGPPVVGVATGPFFTRPPGSAPTASPTNGAAAGAALPPRAPLRTLQQTLDALTTAGPVAERCLRDSDPAASADLLEAAAGPLRPPAAGCFSFLHSYRRSRDAASQALADALEGLPAPPTTADLLRIVGAMPLAAAPPTRPPPPSAPSLATTFWRRRLSSVAPPTHVGAELPARAANPPGSATPAATTGTLGRGRLQMNEFMPVAWRHLFCNRAYSEMVCPPPAVLRVHSSIDLGLVSRCGGGVGVGRRRLVAVWWHPAFGPVTAVRGSVRRAFPRCCTRLRQQDGRPPGPVRRLRTLPLH